MPSWSGCQTGINLLRRACAAENDRLTRPVITFASLETADKGHGRLELRRFGIKAPIRAGSAENLATVRRMAINLLNREKTKKRGIKGKQLNASWNHNYLLRLLNFQMRRPCQSPERPRQMAAEKSSLVKLNRWERLASCRKF